MGEYDHAVREAERVTSTPLATIYTDALVKADQRIAELEAEREELRKFPTMLRKMWSGSEVQQWINERLPPPPEDNTITGATVPGSRKP